MSAYLLTWNPERWPWADLPQRIEGVAAGRSEELRWSTGNTNSIPAGARVFLLRQGVDPLGLLASGWVTVGSYQDEHWDPPRAAEGDRANYVAFVPDALLDPGAGPLLDLRELQAGDAFDVYFKSASSGIAIAAEQHAVIEEAWGRLTKADQPTRSQDWALTGLEGQSRVRMVKHRSRETTLRKAKIAQVMAESGRLACEVPGCGFEFETVYGELGSGYAQVHHLTPLSAGPQETTLADLAVVCANCHVMIHRGGQSRPLQGLLA